MIAAVISSGTQVYRLNENGSADVSFPPTNLSVFLYGLIVQPDNKILYLTGLNIFRLNENGGSDDSFQPPTLTNNGSPEFKLAGDGKIVATISAGIALFRRFLPNGAEDPSFNQYTHPAYASFTIQSDGSIVIGDRFDPGSTSGSNYFVRLTPDGFLDPTFNPGGIGFQNILPGSIRAIEPQPDGKVLLGGKFDLVNDIIRHKIARLNADSTLDTTFQINTSGTGNYFSRIQLFHHIHTQSDGKVVVVGRFDYVLGGVTKSISCGLIPTAVLMIPLI